jgi:tetratricopeptide (TPR) repeat protein
LILMRNGRLAAGMFGRQAPLLWRQGPLEDVEVKVSRAVLAAIAAGTMWFSGCAHDVTAGHAPVPARAEAREAALRLVDQAFAVACSMPGGPHARPRARVQEDAALAALELGASARAIEMAREILDWRRAEVYARAAQRAVDEGRREEALVLAERAKGAMPIEAHWSRERVALETAIAFERAGDPAKTAELLPLVVESDRARIRAAVIPALPAADLPAEADAFDRAIATKDLDMVRSAIVGWTALLRRWADDDALRNRAAQALDGAIAGLPVDLRIDANLQLAGTFRELGRKTDARTRLEAAIATFASAELLPEDEVPIGAMIVEARIADGDVAGAAAELRRLREQFDARRSEIMTTRLARSLRALGVAWARAGDPAMARQAFRDALDAGLVNPNGRPRAEDLVATCIAMATSGTTPDPFTAQKIEAVRKQLGEPW